MKVIGISGKAESGKTYTANLLTTLSRSKGYDAHIIPLASILKEQAKTLGWNGEKDEKGRTFLQDLSKCIKAYHGEDYYVTELVKKILAEKGIIIIDDLRLPIEVDILKKAFGDKFVSIRINRPNHSNSLTSTQRTDISEVGLDDYEFDYIFENTGDKNYSRYIQDNFERFFMRKIRFFVSTILPNSFVEEFIEYEDDTPVKKIEEDFQEWKKDKIVEYWEEI